MLNNTRPGGKFVKKPLVIQNNTKYRPGDVVTLKVALRWFRPHGYGRCPFHRYGCAHRLGEGMAHGCSDDGSSPALPAEALLEDQVQCEHPDEVLLQG